MANFDTNSKAAMTEIWAASGPFEISNLGNVRALDGSRVYLVTRYEKQVARLRGEHSDSFYVHCEVARLFLPNPLGLHRARHIDGDGLNNHVENLAWIDPKDKKISYERTEERKLKHNARTLKRYHETKDVMSERLPCECGRSIRRDKLSKHLKTALHAKRVSSSTESAPTDNSR